MMISKVHVASSIVEYLIGTNPVQTIVYVYYTFVRPLAVPLLIDFSLTEQSDSDVIVPSRPCCRSHRCRTYVHAVTQIAISENQYLSNLFVKL